MAPLRKRPFDFVLVVFFVVFATTSFVFDAQTALDVDLRTSTSLPGRMNLMFAEAADPLLLDPPLFSRVICGISAFVYGPFYLVMTFAFVKGKNWIRLPAIAYAATILYSLVVWFGVEFWGDVRPTNLVMFWAAYLPYVLVPLALLYRMRKVPFPHTR